MNELSARDLLNHLHKVIIDFEEGKVDQQAIEKSLGVIYTPKPLVDFIVLNAFKLYLRDNFNLPKNLSINSYLKNLQAILSKDNMLKKKIIEKLSSFKILDPSCGSGRFLISIANILFKLFRILNIEVNNYELKKRIIEYHLYGIEIEKSACIITKLRLWNWLYSEDSLNLINSNLTIDNLDLEGLNKLVNTYGIKFNLYNLDFLLDFNSDNFDIIIGNPPYVENKKIKDLEFKKRLIKRYQSAYRLFDLSIVFIEKALEILKEHSGFLSMITINKFLAADYGLKIRELLLNNTELKEIVNLSSFPVFGRTAVYPVILSFRKSFVNSNNEVIIKSYQKLNDIYDDSKVKSKILIQRLIKKIPSYVFPIFGQINMINYLYNNFKPLSKAIHDLKIMYRPYGFLNWSNHLYNINNVSSSEKDLILIGTGNVGKYYTKFDKLIKIAKRTIPLSYFKYQPEFKDIWNEMKDEKLIFREVAKELTWIYDPGIYTNVTGLYFVKIPSFNSSKIFCLLAIMNSKLMDTIFKTLFNSLHMAGGYLRFNGSFIKRLPAPHKFPLTLSFLGRILCILSQLQYDSHSSNSFNIPEVKPIINRFQGKITSLLETTHVITDSLVNLLYFDKLYLEYNRDFYKVRKFLNSEREDSSLQPKYLLPRFQIEKYTTYSSEELAQNFDKIRAFLNEILETDGLFSQMKDILNFNYIEP
ncbi:MAG: Eco57I restriction-modification methylase domain-containing protein [Candidatus Thorarchaeota archaeon]